MRRVEFQWSDGLWGRVEVARGDVPRSVFVRRALERALGDVPAESASAMQSRAGVREAAARPSAPSRASVSRADAFRARGQR